MTALKLRESDVQRDCLQYLAALGVMAWRNNTTGIYDPVAKRFRTNAGRNGIADILGVLPGGRALAVECKATGGKVSKDQRYFLDDFRHAGGLAIVAHSVDEMIAALKAEGYHA